MILEICINNTMQNESLIVQELGSYIWHTCPWGYYACGHLIDSHYVTFVHGYTYLLLVLLHWHIGFGKSTKVTSLAQAIMLQFQYLVMLIFHVLQSWQSKILPCVGIKGTFWHFCEWPSYGNDCTHFHVISSYCGDFSLIPRICVWTSNSTLANHGSISHILHKC
jgi:hypothetical protein